MSSLTLSGRIWEQFWDKQNANWLNPRTILGMFEQEGVLSFQRKFNAEPPLQSAIKYVRRVISAIMRNFIIRFALTIWFYGRPPRQKSKGNRFSGYSDCWQDEQNNTQVLMILESPNRHFVVFGKTNYCFLSVRFQQNIYFCSVVRRNADHPCTKIISLISGFKVIYTQYEQCRLAENENSSQF